jgi:transmembrane sensor
VAGQGASTGEAPPVVPPEIAAEAAVWVARLHGPSRNPQMDAECLAWQARSAVHRLAFERCTETWQEVGRVTLSAYASATAANQTSAVAGNSGPAGRLRWAYALALVGLVAVGAAVLQPWRGSGAYSTGVGEQQMVVLDDGTRMSLNTSTRVQVKMGAAQRAVHVQGGEALFEVARDAQRPFVVRAATREVVALGTVFSVRLTPAGSGEALAVTLIEGQVSVRPAPDPGGDGGAVPAPVVMQPGERVRFKAAAGAASAALPQVDRPRIEQVVAWKRNEAIFEDVSLAEAVAEMNRYSRTPIVLLGDAAASGLRVSGQYRTGDNAGFARAVAALHGLAVREQEGRLELAGPH